MSSIWVNSSDEEASDEEEVANLCLVAREDGILKYLTSDLWDFEGNINDVFCWDYFPIWNHFAK